MSTNFSWTLLEGEYDINANITSWSNFFTDCNNELLLLFAHSSGVIPARSLFFIILLWFLVSVPLSFAGSIVAHKQCNWDEHPTKTNQIARQIPYQPWYLRTAQATLIAGIFSFGSIAVELYFIYSSLWFNKIFICLDFYSFHSYC